MTDTTFAEDESDEFSEEDVEFDISQQGISQRQLTIIEQNAELQNQMSTLIGFAQHIDATLDALVTSNNQIGTSQQNMQTTVANMFAAAQKSPMAKMLFGKGEGAKQDG